ncbi:MAG: PspC domain-containing protein [Gammaproteobacteria bacterium]|jgi:phage shock protein PspC (stress-responsive transcriptional regulator)
MKRVITASLNRNAYQFEEDAYARLEAWLAEASARLAGDPDRTEILADLEQAIADQCTQRLRPHQQVVTLEELQPALDHVGRVETPDVGAAAAPEAPASAGAAAPLKLEQISQGAWISGVCLGLARYSGIDPTLVRALAVVLLFITGGGMILLYAVMMLMIPFAPLDASLPAPGTLPTKCREATLYLRAKFATLTTG